MSGLGTVAGMSRRAVTNGVIRRPSFRFSDIWRAPLHDFPIRDEILYQYLPLSPDMDVLGIGPGSGFTAFRLARQVRSLDCAVCGDSIGRGVLRTDTPPGRNPEPQSAPDGRTMRNR